MPSHEEAVAELLLKGGSHGRAYGRTSRGDRGGGYFALPCSSTVFHLFFATAVLLCSSTVFHLFFTTTLPCSSTVYHCRFLFFHCLSLFFTTAVSCSSTPGGIMAAWAAEKHSTLQ